ncbi:MAG TPA: histidine kinase [Polyangia bacterium]
MRYTLATVLTPQRTKLAVIAGLGAALAGGLVLSACVLSAAPRLGVTLAWDQPRAVWRVTAVRPGCPLAPGDELRRLGGVRIGHLEGLMDHAALASRAELIAWFGAKRALHAALSGPTVEVEVLRAGRPRTLTAPVEATGWSFLRRLEAHRFLVSLAFFLVGVLVLSRRPVDAGTLVFLLMCLAMTVLYLSSAAPLVAELSLAPAYFAAMNLLALGTGFLAPALLVHFAVLVPRPRAFLRRWLVVAYYLGCGVMLATLPLRLMRAAIPVCFLLSLAAVGQGLLSSRNPVERQQAKWVAAALGFGVLPWLAVNGLAQLFLGRRLMNDAIPAAFVILIPVFVAFALQRMRLVDVDALFEGTVVYVITGLILLVVELAFLALLSSRVGRALEVEPAGKVLLPLVVIVALYAPTRDWVRRLQRRLFARREPDEVAAMTALIDRASGQPPAAVLEVFAAVVRRALQPEPLCWARAADAAAAPLLARLRGQSGPVALWEPGWADALPRPDLLLALPVEHRGEVTAALLLGVRPGGRFYSRPVVSVLRALLKQTGILYDNACLFEEHARQQEATRERDRRQLAERDALMRDLHDGLGGTAARIALLAEGARRPGGPDGAEKTLAVIADLARDSLAEVRGFLSALDTPGLDWDELVSNLRYEGGRTMEAHGLQFGFEARLAPGLAPPTSAIALTLQRVLKEALTNVIKHARAHAAQAELTVTGAAAALVVADDGVGLGPPAPAGRGLASMRHRAELVGGRLTVLSDGGVRVRLEVPLEAGRPRAGAGAGRPGAGAVA